MTAADRARQALFKNVDRVYVINLPWRTDRRAEMAAQLRRFGLDFEDDRVVLVEAIAPADAGPFPSPAIRGCFESHLAVLRSITESSDRAALVLEDDADFMRHAVARFPGIAAALETRDWGMVFGWPPKPHPMRDKPGDLTLFALPPEQPLPMTHCYAITKETAALALPYLSRMLTRSFGDPDGGPMEVDGAYGWFRAAHPEIAVLCPEVPIAMQRPSRSDIHAGAWFDRLRWTEPFARGLRRARIALFR